MILVTVTRLHLHSPLHFPAFLWHTALSSWQIINTPGFLGGKLTGDKQGGSWTITLWKDEIAMKQYRNSGSHRQAMGYLPHWCDEASVVHWEQEDISLPDALEAQNRIICNGFFTKLPHASAAHQHREIPKPFLPKGITLHPRTKNSPVPIEV
jgi:hypothetical protein